MTRLSRTAGAGFKPTLPVALGLGACAALLGSPAAARGRAVSRGGPPVAALPDSTTPNAWAAARAPGGRSAGTPSKGFVVLEGIHESLTHGYDDQSGVRVRGVVAVDPRNTVSAELSNLREFGKSGSLLSVGDTFTINEDWYGSVSAAVGSNAFYLPKLRADAFLSRKWGPRRNLVTSVGLGYFRARDDHKDTSVALESIYYFKSPFVAQAGVRWNRSSPGSITSRSQFIALTQGREREHYVTLRYGFGREAYQVIGAKTAISDFSSTNLSLNWRQWVAPKWGFTLFLERYSNPTYRRTGGSIGVFTDL